MMPGRQIVDGVRARDEVERHVEPEARTEQSNRVRCIGDALAAHLNVRRLEVRIVRHREPRHRQPVLSRLDLLLQLER